MCLLRVLTDEGGGRAGAAPGAITAIVVVNAVRGVGFAVSVVAGGALTAALIPAERRGEGLALVGLVGGVPALLALPFGTWAAGHLGYGLVFVVTAVAPLVAIATVPGLPARDGASGRSHGLAAGLRNPALVPSGRDLRPVGVCGRRRRHLSAARGSPRTRRGSSRPRCWPQPATSTAGRWFAGRLGDRHGQTRLLVPGVLLCVVGMTAMATTGVAPVVVAGAAVFGAGFGVMQNATLALMYVRVPAAGYGTVSAIWNGAYDLGMAAGAIAVGGLVTLTGFSAAFLIVGAANAARARPGPAGRATGPRVRHVQADLVPLAPAAA